MAIKKTQLYKHLWEAANALRGGMDASQYKDYVLTILFVKYVTDRYKGDPYAPFVVPEGGSFDDLVEAKGRSNIGERINTVLHKLAEENDLRGIINHVDFDDDAKLGTGKEKVDRLTKLISIFEHPELNFSNNRADGDDILGDVYEYFMKKFASEAGKSKGQFYTPAEVSRIMAQIIGAENVTSPQQSVYDPTCGSGSLLLKVAETAKDNTEIEMSIYGQEIDIDVANLAKMNMIMHDFPTAEIVQGNTLANPKFKEKDGSLKTFDFAVANPPFSQKNWLNGVDPEHDPYRRFELGIPPAKNGDYAFLLHLLKSLKPKGKGAIILPHGVLFRGKAEAKIRRNLINRGYIKAIIGLPSNLFYGTGIPAIIMVLDKENAAARKGIFMIDASKGFRKDGAKNRLRERDIHKIVTTFRQRKEIPGYARMVSLNEISENDYNLNIPRYIDNTEEEDIQDIYAHLHGGIPRRDIDRMEGMQVFPQLKNDLFAGNGEDYYRLKTTTEDLQEYIEQHPEILTFRRQAEKIFEEWAAQNKERLYAINGQTRVKKLIKELSASMLAAYEGLPMTDAYAMYQVLMDYWDKEMKDDVYMILEKGWRLTPYRIIDINKKGKKTDKGWVCDLLPKEITANVYFPDERKEIERLQNAQEAKERELETLLEENTDEDSIFEEVKNEKGKITKGEVKKKIKELKSLPAFEEEIRLLQTYLTLTDEIANIKKQIKQAEKDLNAKLLKKYTELNENEIKKLVVENKWFDRIRRGIEEETEDTLVRMAMRIKELAERYAEPLPDINRQVEELEQKVRKHLQRMGYTWE